MAIIGKLALTMTIVVLLVRLPCSVSFTFTKEPQSPITVVLGHNTTNVYMEWKYDAQGSTVVNIDLKRFLASKDNSLSNETLLVYFAPGYKDWNRTLYVFSASLAASGYANFTIKDVLKRPDNTDMTKVSYLSGELYTYRLDVTTIRPSQTVTSSTVDLQVYFPSSCAIHPNAATVNETDNVLLTVTTTGIPPVQGYTWTFPNGSTVSRDNNILTFTASRQDAGTYKVTVHNGVGGPSECTSDVIVQFKPRLVNISIIKDPPSTVREDNGIILTNETDSFNLTCESDAKPAATYKWTVPDPSLFTELNQKILVFYNVSRDYAGEYICTASNIVGDTNSKKNLTVYYKPDAPSLSQPTMDACENKSINISCMADAYPPVATYSLYNGDNYLGSSSNGQFSITATQPGKNTLCCVALNEIGNSQCGHAAVLVLGVITPVCRINNETTSSATVNEGDEVVLQCDISGNESYYSYRWLEVKDSMSRSISSAIQLRFDSINRTNEAQYQVTIEDRLNCFASQRRSFNITVNYKPENTMFSSDKKVFCEGNSTQVNCAADGKPDPVYSLYRNNEYLSGNENGVFLLTFAEKGNYKYTCVSNNTAGVGPNKSQNVVVKGPLSSKMCTINNKNISQTPVKELSLVDLRLTSSELERLDFTWKNGTKDMNGLHSQNLTFGSITRHEGGTYRVVARDRFNCSANVECIFTVDVNYFDQGNICGNRNPEFVANNGSQAKDFSVNTTGLSNPAFNVTCTGNVIVYLSNSSYKIEVKPLFAENKEKGQHCVFNNTVGSCSINVVIWMYETIFKSKNKVRLRSRNFTSDLQNNQSTAFLNLKNDIEKAFLDIYKIAEKEYCQAVIVIRFESGSVWVNFELVLIARVPNPLQPLKDAILENNGNINGLIFEENSLSKGFQLPETTVRPTTTPIPTTIESTTPVPPDDPTVIIIVVIVVVLVVIAIAGVVIWWCCKRKASNGKDPNLVNDRCPVEIPMNEEPGTNNQGYSPSDYAESGPQHIEPAYDSVDRRPKDAKDKNDNRPQSGGEQGNPTYAAVDKSQKPKKKIPGELHYADLSEFRKDGDKAAGGRGGIVLVPLPKGKDVKMPEAYQESDYAELIGFKKPADDTQNPVAGGTDDAPFVPFDHNPPETDEGAQKSGQAPDPAKNEEQKTPGDQQEQPLSKEDSAKALNPNRPADSIHKLNGRNETTMTTVSL